MCIYKNRDINIHVDRLKIDKYINQLIKKKGELPSKSHIKKIYRDNGNPSSSQLAKTWKQLQKEIESSTI